MLDEIQPEMAFFAKQDTNFEKFRLRRQKNKILKFKFQFLLLMLKYFNENDEIFLQHCMFINNLRSNTDNNNIFSAQVKNPRKVENRM